MKSIKLAALTMVLLIVATTSANADGLSYSFIELAHEDADIELSSGSTVEADATLIQAFFGFNEDIYFGGGIFDGESGNIDLEGWGIFAGAHHPLSVTTDLVVEVSHTEVKASLGTFSDTEGSEDIGIGIRTKLTPKVEGTLFYSYGLDSDNDDSYGAGVLFDVTNQVTIGAGFSKGDDWDAFSVRVRLNY